MIPSKLIQLFIMEAGSGNLYFHMKYKNHGLLDGDPNLTAAWLTSIFIFADANTGSLQKISLGSYDILLRLGEDSLLAAYLESDEENENQYREQMAQLQSKFEIKYREHIRDFDGRTETFGDFYFDTLVVFPYFRFDFDKVLGMSGPTTPMPFLSGGQRIIETVFPLINGVRRVRDIWNLCSSKMTLNEFNAAISFLYHERRAVLKENSVKSKALRIVAGDEIYGTPVPPYLKERALSRVYQSFGEKLVNEVLSYCNGQRGSCEIGQLMKADESAIEYVVRRLLQSGTVVLVDKPDGMVRGDSHQ